MTDRDLEEFKRWHSVTCYSDDELVRLRFLESWKAACEYKDRQLEQGMKGSCPTCEPVGEVNEKLQSQVSFLKDRNETLVAKVTYLNQVNDGLHLLLKDGEAENKKLRDALSLSLNAILELWEMPDVVHLDDHGEVINIARKALDKNK
jgi:hypothetical protein